MDISRKALQLAQYHIGLHHIAPTKIKLVQMSDGIPKISLSDHSVDYIYCGGVLHHLTNPKSILKEFYRILKPNSEARIMVYNRDSLWFNLYTAYYRIIICEDFQGLTLTEAFSRNTDGPLCPISKCYKSQEFSTLCQSAGFNKVDYLGGFLSDTEMCMLHQYGEAALNDARLGSEQKEFLQNLEFDCRGFPKFEGKHAGIGGVYRLVKE